jgi:hypothetical protein
MLNVPITPPRVPLIDPRTGLIDRAWYLFFLSLNDAATTSETVVDIGSDAVSLISSYDAALQALAQVVETQPLPADSSVELAKQIDAVALDNNSTALVSQLAEIQKQVEALQITPQQVVRLMSELADVSFTNLAPYDTLIYNGTWTNIPFVTRAKGRFVYV